MSEYPAGINFHVAQKSQPAQDNEWHLERHVDAEATFSYSDPKPIREPVRLART